jgi:hypothetical protein
MTSLRIPYRSLVTTEPVRDAFLFVGTHFKVRY